MCCNQTYCICVDTHVHVLRSFPNVPRSPIAPPYTALDGYHTAHAAVVDSHTHDAPSCAALAHDALARDIATKHPISSLAHVLHDPIPDPPHPHMPRTIDMPRLRHALWFSKTSMTHGDDVSALST